jgi:hypothetical protein
VSITNKKKKIQSVTQTVQKVVKVQSKPVVLVDDGIWKSLKFLDDKWEN